jgi:tRNA G26 N,N-dimethylase Trm1
MHHNSSFVHLLVTSPYAMVLCVLLLLQTDWAKAAADTADSNGLVILDALAATALRSIRYTAQFHMLWQVTLCCTKRLIFL